MSTTFIPDHYGITYTLESTKKTFTQYRLLYSEKVSLSDLIRIENNNGFNVISGAHTLLRIRNASNWKKCSLTGLRPIGMSNFYYADLPVKGVKSLCVVFYDRLDEIIQMRITPQFYPHNKTALLNTVNHIITTFKF